VLFLPGDAQKEGSVGGNRVLDSSGLNNLGGQGRADEGVIDVAPSALGGVARIAEGNAA
jgi:hypothetical protein